MNFDLEDVQPFLLELSQQILSGFSEQSARDLADEIARLPVKEELRRRYVVKYEGSEVPLWIDVYMDDEDAPELYILAPPDSPSASTIKCKGI